MATTMTADVVISGNGSTIVTFDLLTPEAREWVEDFVEVPDYMWTHTGFHCDHSCAQGIAMGMEDAGLTLRED